MNKQVKMLYNPLKVFWTLDLNLVYSRSIDVYLLALKSHMLDIFLENEFMKWKLILFSFPRKSYTIDEMRIPEIKKNKYLLSMYFYKWIIKRS